ncbi:hypothetical protein [Pantoea sp.]|uniref:hypothetical protein n=1 Tax=Pantoea sp. TaxID=69393 RepID=UPI00289F0F00|nr:hypothetical protein [Pantoea sp.]
MSGFTAAKQAYDLLKLIKESHDQAIISGAIGDLHGKITELQMLNAKLSGLYQSERDVAVKLREEKAKIEMFTVKAENYELHTTEGGSTVYRSKKPTGSTIPHHHLCTHCYSNSVISILQPGISTTKSAGYFVHYCPQCKNEYRMGKLPPVKPVSVRFPY